MLQSDMLQSDTGIGKFQCLSSLSGGSGIRSSSRVSCPDWDGWELCMHIDSNVRVFCYLTCMCAVRYKLVGKWLKLACSGQRMVVKQLLSPYRHTLLDCSQGRTQSHHALPISMIIMVTWCVQENQSFARGYDKKARDIGTGAGAPLVFFQLQLSTSTRWRSGA
jgi:hypothetical protein